MESSLSAPGTVVHVLSQVKYAEKDSWLNETYYALQIRPSKPFAPWVSSNFILSKLLSVKPLKCDMFDKDDFDRFILIPSDKYSTIEEAFKIASLCEQLKAVGVVISLPSDDSSWEGWVKEKLFGEDKVSIYVKLTKLAKIFSERSFTELDRINIPVFALLPKAVEKISNSRRSYPLRIRIESLDMTFFGGAPYQRTNFVEKMTQSIGTGTLDKTKLLNFGQFLSDNTTTTLSSGEKEDCFCVLRKMSDNDTFLIGMEMAEYAFKHFGTEDEISLRYFYSYFIDVKWTKRSIESANTATLFINRIKKFLRFGISLDLSIGLLAFLSEADALVDNSNFVLGVWGSIIDFHIKSKLVKEQEQAIEAIYRMMDSIKKAGHHLPFSYECFNLVINAVNVGVFSLCIKLFYFFESPPSNEKDSVFIRNFTKKILEQCRSFHSFSEIIREIRLLNRNVRECVIEYPNSNLFQILSKFSAADALLWVKSPEYQCEKHRTLSQSDIEILLVELSQTPTDQLKHYFDLMQYVESSYSTDVTNILIDKLRLIYQQSKFAFFQVLVTQNIHSILISHFDQIEIVLRNMGPMYDQFQSVVRHLRSFGRTTDVHLKRVVTAFIAPIFKDLSIYDAPNQLIFQDSMLNESSSILFNFIEECLSFWHGKISNAGIFKSHRSLLGCLRSISGASNKSKSIFFNVIEFSSRKMSKGFQIASEWRNSFQLLCCDLMDAKVELVQELHSFLRGLEEMECAFRWPNVSSNKVSDLKTKIDEWRNEIRADTVFISKLKSHFHNTAQSTFPDSVHVTDNCNNMTVRELEQYHGLYMSFCCLFSESSKKFFLYFETNNIKSVLFSKYISFLEPFALAVFDSALVVEHLINVEKQLRKTLYSDELSMQEVLDISENLSKHNRTPEVEMKVLSDYFFADSEVGDRTAELIRMQSEVMELLSMREQLVGLVIDSHSMPSVFHRLSFDVGEEADYKQLQLHVRKIEEKEILLKLSSTDCVNTLNSILGCFGVGTTVDKLRGILKLLHNLIEADKVWEFFVRRPEFVSGAGQGYSELFSEKVEVFLVELSKEDCKLVDCFRTAAFWVCLVLPTTGQSFSVFCRTVLSSERFLIEINRRHGLFNFGELISSQSNMDFITQLFQNGSTGLDSVLEQLKSIRLNSAIEFNLRLGQLEIRYYDEKRKYELVMASEQVKDFEQRLEFIQHEEKAANHNISAYLKQLLVYRRGLGILCGLFESGHPKLKTPLFILSTDQMKVHTYSFEMVVEWLEGLQYLLRTWEAKIEVAGKDDSILCIFTIKQARRISSLIVDGSVSVLFNSVAHLFVDKVSKNREFFKVLKRVVDSIRCASRSSNAVEGLMEQNVDIDWLQTFQSFFKDLTQSAVRRGVPLSICPVADDGIPQSNTRYIASADTAVIKKLLCFIFGHRRPGSFQLLWCHHNIGIAEVSSFIQRAKSYENLRFAVISFNLLNQSAQSLFLKTILQNKSIRNLHFIECGTSILKSASWLPVFKADDVCRDIDLLEHYSGWYKDAGEVFNKKRQLCYVGKSGSGKSHQIRKLMKQFRRSLIVPITEEFDQSDIFSRISKGLEHCDDEQVLLVFQVNISKLRENAVARWLALMNSIDNLIFQLLILRSVVVLDTDFIINLPWGSKWIVALELPDRDDHLEGIVCDSGLDVTAPTVNATFTFISASSLPFDIDEDSRLVCKYLKAFESGLIDTLYTLEVQDTDVIFVLDNSGSMSSNNRLGICKARLKNIIESKLKSTSFQVGLIIFNDSIKQLSLGPFDSANKSRLFAMIDNATASGGTNMWSALNRALSSFSPSDSKRRQVIVALTDGGATDPQISDSVQSSLATTHKDVQVIFMTVNLDSKYREEISRRCIRDVKRDRMIDAQDGDSLDEAWTTVGELLTVSERIMKQAANITDEECLRLLRKYMALDRHSTWSKLEQTFWVRYMHRRCQILAASERFNTNQKPTFGSTTMTIMLNEVDRVLSKNHHVDWHSIRHEQMVFRKQIIVQADGQQREDYSWSVLCSNPNDQESDWVQRKTLLKDLGMQVPTIEDMKRSDRRVLDSYLAYGIGVQLKNTRIENSSSGYPFDFQLGSLPLLNDFEFVLTLDFTIKLLTINERIECGIPCIIQGETGVSKTALTRMLFILKNGSIRYTPLFTLVKEDAAKTKPLAADSRKLSALHVIARHWKLEQQEVILQSWQDCGQLAYAIQACSTGNLQKYIFDELKANPMLDPLESLSSDKFLSKENSALLLLWFVDALIQHSVIDADMHWAFNVVNVHAAMSIKEIEDTVTNISQRAQRLAQLGEYLDSRSHKIAKLCIFFDEVNTSSHMGILKEIITNHTVNGVEISKNVVIVAACNPARKKINFFSNRKQEHGIEWVAGHFQTHPLPPSIEAILWDYGSLHPNQEEDFIKQRLELFAKAHRKPWDSRQICEFTKLVNSAHQVTRKLAVLHVESLVQESDIVMEADEVLSRANSALSLRDILRCFKIYHLLSSSPPIISSTFIGSPGSLSKDKCLWLLAIGIVYYLRLGGDAFNAEKDYRRKFKTEFQSLCGLDADVREVSKRAMDALMKHTELQPGIAPTEGLQENIYVVLVCLMAKVPVMIVGPPGSSKTLAVGILAENARGEYSRSEMYRAISMLIPFHYQCSRRSTSQQIEDVFKRAIERQAKASREAGRVSCFVFMDEAGLPEEGRESLKVLHYYLENYLRVEAEVGFVAISNHVLDAAKTNRCNLLMRSSPDHEELLKITTICSKLQLDLNCCTCYVSGIESDGCVHQLRLTTDTDEKYNIFAYLCEAFEACMAGSNHPKSRVPKVNDFIEVFGLRDYMNFIMLLGRMACAENCITRKLIKDSIERNFSGSSKLATKDIINYFMSSFANSDSSKLIKLENPISLLMRSLSEQYQANEPTGRYIMFIDTTTSDGVLRFLLEHSISRIRKMSLLKLGDFVEDSHTQQMTLISQTRFAMEKGDFVVLSHSEATNESFYDLFNQHFKKFVDRNEGKVEVVYHTNIAVGADSRRCRVLPQFQCLMHLTVGEFNVAPAPLLNRFEKYRITMTDALEFMLANHPCRIDFPLATVVSKVLLHLRALFETVGYDSFLGYSHKQTVESCFIQILDKLDSEDAIQNYIIAAIRGSSCLEYVVNESSLTVQEKDHVYNAAQNRSFARDYFKNPINERHRDHGINLFAQAILTDAVTSFVDISLPECLLAKAAFLPPSLIDLVVVEEKFRFDRRMCHQKQIIYTRSTADLVKYQAINQGQIDVISLGEHKEESQFTSAISNFMTSDHATDRLILIIDLSVTPPSSINFVRNKLDSINVTDTGKSFTILIHGANVDIRSHCIYDIVFESKWSQKFVDSFSDAHNICWLQIAYTVDIFDVAEISKVIWVQLEIDLPFALERIAERVTFSGNIECLTRDNLLQALQSTEFSLREKLLESCLQFWLNDTSRVPSNDVLFSPPASYMLLRYEIQSIVQKYAANSFNISLLQFLDDEMRSIFTKFLSYYIAALFEDVSFVSLQENSLDKTVVKALLDGLEFLPLPDLGTLSAPIKYFQIQSPTGKSFPFFRRLHHFLEVQVSRIVRLHEIDDNDVVWENMYLDFMDNCVDKQQATFEVKYYMEAVHSMDMDSTKWEVFLHKFVSVKFPSASDLQSRFISFWLRRQVIILLEENISSHCGSSILFLYMTCKMNEKLLHSFFQCLSQFSALSTSKKNIDKFLDDFDGDSEITELSSITSRFVHLCYDAMMVCETVESYSLWAQSVSTLLLKPTSDILTNHNRKFRVMTAIMAASSLVTENINWNAQSFTHFRENLYNDSSELTLSRILHHFRNAMPPECEFNFICLMIRTTGAQLSKDDKLWIMDEIIVNPVLASPVQWAPLLDILLLGIIDENTNTMEANSPKSMNLWVDLVADMKLLEPRVVSTSSQVAYVPDFVRGSDDLSRFPFLADVTFHVVWKWMHTFCSSDTSISDIKRLKIELLSNERSDAVGIKKIVLVAYDLLIIKRWIDMIIKRESAADSETLSIVADIVGNCQPRERWIQFSLNLLLKADSSLEKGGVILRIRQWRSDQCSEHGILVPWLDECELQSENDNIFQEDFSLQNCLNISNLSRIHEDPIALVAANIWNLDKLIYIWVLPYMWQFYVWLTNEMTNYVIETDSIKSLSIGQVIENCKKRPEQEYCKDLVSLWIKMKVGIQRYTTNPARTGFNVVDESTSVWDLISTYDSDGTHNGVLIDLMVEMLTVCKRILFNSDGSSEKVLQDIEQLENIENITSFSPALLDYYLKSDADNYADSFLQKVVDCSQHLSHCGIWQRLVWIAVTSQTALLLDIEISRMRQVIPDLLHLRIKPRYCTFSGNSGNIRSLPESSFEPIFHCLEKLEIQLLLRSLQFYESTVSSNEFDSMEDILDVVHGRNNLDLTRIFGIREPNQLAFLLTLQIREVPKLIGYLNSLIQSEIYLFFNKPLEIKKSWPPILDEKLNQLPALDPEFSRDARALEALLIDSEKILSESCDSALIARLEKLFKSEDVLLASYPLLKDIDSVFCSADCRLSCGHYVYLRLKLRAWIASLKMKAPDRAWDWGIQSHMKITELTSDFELILRKIPWFMQDAVSSEAFQPEIDLRNRRKTNRAAKRIQMQWRKVRVTWYSVLPESNVSQHFSNVKTNPRRAVRSRPSESKIQDRGLGILSQFAKEKEDSQILLGQLEIAFKDPKLKVNFVRKLKSIIEDKRILPPDKEKPVYAQARSFIDSFENEVSQWISTLNASMAAVPIEFSIVKDAKDRLFELEATDSSEYKKCCYILERAEGLLSEQRGILEKGTASISAMKRIEKEAEIRGIALDPLLFRLKTNLEIDNQILLNGWRALHLDETIIELLVQACECFPTADDPFLLRTATDAQREHLTRNGYIDQIDCRGDENTQKEVFDKLRPDINKPPLYSWVHSVALAAVASVMPTQIDYYRHDVWDYIKRYLENISRQPKKDVANIIMLAFARMNPNCEKSFRIACLRKAYSPKAEKWMTDLEFELLQSAINENDADHLSAAPQKQIVDELILRWETLKNDDNAVSCPSIDKVMKMVGLKVVKEKILELYESFLAERDLDPEAKVVQSHNFILLGNPGTGKTTAAKILAEFLAEIGIRSTSTFVESTGEALVRMGINKVQREISKAKNGVFFIDEAYTLNPSSNADGKAIAELLLDVAESKRHEITIILAGYKDDIEDKLFNFNSGFASRFPYVFTFDDYSDEELGSIFRQMCVEKHWKYASEDVIRAAARRVGRGRGRKTFSNARAVRALFENAYRQALRRGRNHAQTFILADVLGPKPSMDTGSDLKAALDELNRTIGLTSVKNEIFRLVNMASNNYDRELRGEKPLPVTLNRVFFGNPGTGKTKVAKLYGRILKGLGLLSDGQCELKQPKDFIGAVVGESQNKTAALIQRCTGKVLIVDEAYGFFGSSFGADAVNALVGLVHNAPGEDIAIIMIGYEKQMRKMFREMNEGLARRFSLNNPIIFEDYTDEELGRVAIKFAEANELTLPLSVREALTRSVGSQKYSPSFGNAGTVINMITNAMAALTLRNPNSKILCLEDLGLSSTREDPIAVIEKEFKMEHIVLELKMLRAVIEQCERDGEDIKEHVKNYVFVGNPGTGKTTVARKMADFLHNLGLLGRSNVVVRSGLELQGSYLGQTKDKVIEAMTEAQGGVLFIDEAYSLGSQDSHGSRFAQEAVDQLVASMTEPEHLNRTVIILAGYPGKMDAMLQANQGLSSRFRGRMNFPDWDVGDCVTFITRQIRKRNKCFDDAATDQLKSGIAEIHSRPGWANARDCITLISNLYQSRASRQSTSDSYEIDDVNNAINSFKISRPVQAPPTHLPPPPPASFAEQESVIAHLMPPKPDISFARSENIPSEPFSFQDHEKAVEEKKEFREDNDDRDSLFVALLEACRDAGYDNNHDKRKELITILSEIESGERREFPDDIMDIIESKTGRSAQSAIPILRSQVHVVLDGMRNAVRAVEEEKLEMRRLEEEGRQEERRQREMKRDRQLEALRLSGLCPMGYSWHRQGEGWRCAGGSHYMSDDSIMAMCT